MHATVGRCTIFVRCSAYQRVSTSIIIIIIIIITIIIIIIIIIISSRY